MTRGRHAKTRSPRSGAPVFLLLALLILAAGAAPFVFEEADTLRASVLALAVLSVAGGLVSQLAHRSTLSALRSEANERTAQTRMLLVELERVHLVHSDLLYEVSGLREHLAQYVAPVLVAPEPVYPSLQLPLVRAAFAGESVAPAARLPRPSHRMGERLNVAVETDSGSDPMPSRRLLDLTPNDIAELRSANSA